MKIVIATGNKGKLEEFVEAFEPYDIEIVSAAQLGIADFPEETGANYQENALIKANYVSNESGLMALGDDSGIEVLALNNEPGLFSARYGGISDSVKRNNYLLSKLNGISNREAKFVASLVLVRPNLPFVAFRGEANGRIIDKASGKEGFGYDPIFYSHDLKKTFAEATRQEKQDVSHRGRAIAKLLEYLKQEYPTVF